LTRLAPIIDRTDACRRGSCSCAEPRQGSERRYRALVPLDPDSKRFQQEIDDLVRRWAGDDAREYWRWWKQLGTWSMDKTQGDVVKKSALKKRLMQASGGRCQRCKAELPAAALQMHRLDPELAYRADVNFGYIESNVELLCASCHQPA
jgi:hypothetical protein